ncbi:MAG: esterase-like activity of phytase family protein [Vicinamibacterales bacterium]
MPAVVPGGFEVAGTYLLPETRIDGTGAVIAELSGAWYDERTRELLTVIDRRDQSTLITMELSVAPEVSLRPTRAVRVERALANRTMDLEGVAPARDGHVFISSEGEAVNPEAPTPGVFEYTREGRLVRSLPIPAAYLGLRSNLGFEALSASPDGRRLFVGAESSLRQDGGPATVDAGALTRILVLDPTGLAGPHEYAYRTEPVPRLPEGRAASGDNGVPEMLAIGSHDLLVLERAYVAEKGSGGRSANGVRIFHVHLDPDAEVTGRWSLKETPPTAALRKTLVLDLATLASQLPPRLANLENFEAMSFGPVLPDGRRTLLLVSDNNCSDQQVTALVVLAYGAPALRTR